MNTRQKILLGMLLLLGTFAGGYWAGRGDKQIEIREVRVKGDTVEKIVERIVEKIRIVKPDGTVEEREITKDTTRDKKDTIISEGKDTRIIPSLPKWGVGGGIGIDTGLDSHYYVTGRYRVIRGIWIDTSVSTNKQAAIGISGEF